MDPMIILDIISRWIHVGAAIVLLGGAVFMRYVLMPSASATLGDAEHDSLRTQLLGRWKKYVMVGITLLLLSGFYNYIAVAIPQHKGEGLYHGLMGTKILLALAVFFLASALTGRSPKFEGLRQNRARWLSVLILLAALVVAIAGALKLGISRPVSPAAASTLLHSDIPTT